MQTENQETPETPETPPPGQKQEQTGAPDLLIETEKTVSFDARFFHSVEGSYFKLLDDTGEPSMIMPLAEGDVSLKLSGIKRELGLAPEDRDARTLDTIAEALKYVSTIRAGDHLPSEMLSGRASWEVSQKDRSTAHNRVTMQLVSWMSGDEILVTEPEQLAQIAEDPKTREKINAAFVEAAESLGFGKDNWEDVLSLVGNLAEELAYIETLRGKFHKVASIHEMVLDLKGKYKSEMSVMDVITPALRLFKIALGGLHDSFNEIDAQTGEILSVLKNIKSQTRFIRNSRDDLRRRLSVWEGQIEVWEVTVIKRSQHNELLLDELYQFLAQRFLPTQDWELLSKALEKTKKHTTERKW